MQLMIFEMFANIESNCGQKSARGRQSIRQAATVLINYTLVVAYRSAGSSLLKVELKIKSRQRLGN